MQVIVRRDVIAWGVNDKDGYYIRQHDKDSCN